MRGITTILLALTACVATANAQGTLPKDVHPGSRSRLPPINGKEEQGAAAIRLHGSGVNVRWASPLGRQLTELAILTTAREHDQPYEWSLHEMEALAVGLDPRVIDIVRHRKPLAGLADKEAVIIEVGREVLSTYKLRSETYARALKAFGERDLVDIVDLMGQHAGQAVLLAAFDQHLPADRKPLLPIP